MYWIARQKCDYFSDKVWQCSFFLWFLRIATYTHSFNSGFNSDVISMYVTLLWKTIFVWSLTNFHYCLSLDFKGFSAFEVKATCKEQLCHDHLEMFSTTMFLFTHAIYIKKQGVIAYFVFVFTSPGQFKYISVSNLISISVFLKWELLYPIPFDKSKKKLFPYKLTMLT